MPDKESHGSYTKHITLSTEMIQTNVKFFHNPSFRARLQEYVLDTHGIECQIGLLETQEIFLTLIGIKHNVKAARDTIKNLFNLIQTKTYDNEETDQKMISWSQYINSDLIIPVIQQIMNNQNIITLWSKTAMFYGYLNVVYFNHESFKVSEERITEILKTEIAYVEDIAMPSEKTKNLLNSIDQYILNRQNPELTIIRTKYPYRSDLKISLFGRKNLVKKTKKQMQSIISKHTIRQFPINMNVDQYEYLLDNCIEQLKDIEDEFKDDGVKIRMRQKEFRAPQYLIEKMKQRVKELIFQTVNYRFEKIGNSFELTDDNNNQLNRIAQHNYCRIEKIETKSEMKIYPIPKALSQLPNMSSSIIQQSKKFYSSLSVRKISVLNGSIEIYLTDQTISIPRDVTIISCPAGATNEQVEYIGDNGYFEMKSGRKLLFHRWSPIVSNDDQTNKKLKKSIEKFISSALENAVGCFSNAQKIAFSTSEWENAGNQEQQQQLANIMINQVKREIEITKNNWHILFVFNNQQINIYKVFHESLIQLQTDEDGFAQFLSPISTVQITLTTSSNFDLTKCKNELEDYVRKYILANKPVNKQSDIKHWDQHMINSFYKYCLDKSVLPTMDQTTNSQINLIGTIANVEKAVEKYKLMDEIMDEKVSLRIPPPVTPRTSKHGKHSSNQNNKDLFNIYFSYCQHDQSIASRIATHLIGEGYTICETPSDLSSFHSYMDRADIILVAFSTNYAANNYSIGELNYATLKGKQLVPFVIRYKSDTSSWLSSLTLAESFYDLFDTEINIQFNDDFDLEYDKLLLKLLGYSKPGTTGKLHPKIEVLPNIIANPLDYEKAAFGYKSMALEQITPAQHLEREQKYQVQKRERIENEKLPDDEIEMLETSLKIVINDLEAMMRGEDPDAESSDQGHDQYSRRYKSWSLNEGEHSYFREFSDCIKRWLNKSPNVIKGNIAPFTPTGDINDAVFIIPQSSIDQIIQRSCEPFDVSPPDKYFSPFNSNPGSWFSNEQSEEYFQKLIESTKPTTDMKLAMENDEIAWDTVSLFQGENDNDTDDIKISELKTPEQMRKLEKLDDPNRVWKKTRVSKDFIQLKIKNILELRQLCENSV